MNFIEELNNFNNRPIPTESVKKDSVDELKKKITL